MNISGIQSGMIGMALFDTWEAAISKTHGTRKDGAVGLVAAAGKAFEAYAEMAEIGMAAMIAGAATYALNPGGNSVSPVTAQEIAPLLALNIKA